MKTFGFMEVYGGYNMNQLYYTAGTTSSKQKTAEPSSTMQNPAAPCRTQQQQQRQQRQRQQRQPQQQQQEEPNKSKNGTAEALVHNPNAVSGI